MNFIKNNIVLLKKPSVNYFFVSIVFLISLYYRSKFPINAAIYAPHDDLLGVRIAQQILSGNWLGPWNQSTLVKPPGFSIYLSIIHYIPLSYVLVNHLIYLLISFWFIFKFIRVEIRDIYYSQILLSAGFLYLAFNPYLFQTAISKVYRSTLNSILIMAFIVIYFRIMQEFRSKNKLQESKIIVLSLFIGLVYAFLILTRVDSYWILLVSMVIFLLILFQNNWTNKRKLKLLFLTIFPAFIAYGLIIGSIIGLNNKYYKVNLIENYYSGNFAQAVNKWTGIEINSETLDHVVIPRVKRDLVYENSPIAQTLIPYLESEPNTGWKTQSCSRQGICDESASWFPWELRDAAVAGSDIRSELEFQNFFKGISQDIDRACASKTLLCGREGTAPGSKNLIDLNPVKILRHVKLNLEQVFRFTSGGNISIPDNGFEQEEEFVKEFHQVVNYKTLNQKEISSLPKFSKSLSLLVKTYTIVNLVTLLIFIFFVFWKKREMFYYWPQLIFLTTSLITFMFGLSIFEIHLGFIPPLDLYFLPIYPVISALIIIVWLSIAKVLVMKNKN